MIEALFGLPKKVNTLLNRWTDAKAAFLDASVASRLPTNDARLDHLDADISGITGYQGIKSIQRGTFTATDGTSNITVSSVNMQKSFITYSISGLQAYSQSVRVRLTTSTNIEVYKMEVNGGSAYDPKGSWELIEWY